MNDEATRKTLIVGWALLALFVPLGLTLEALHALKLPVYLDSVMRREMWTLAHAHGNLLGILCVAFAAVAKRTIPDEVARASIARWLRWGAVMMPCRHITLPTSKPFRTCSPASPAPSRPRYYET